MIVQNSLKRKRQFEKCDKLSGSVRWATICQNTMHLRVLRDNLVVYGFFHVDKFAVSKTCAERYISLQLRFHNQAMDGDFCSGSRGAMGARTPPKDILMKVYSPDKYKWVVKSQHPPPHNDHYIDPPVVFTTRYFKLTGCP